MNGIVLDIIILLGLLILLVKSADLLEDAFVHIAHKLRLNPFLIGFVVLSVASSLPEISVAVNSSIKGVPGVSIGNLLGATIVILSLIIGINAIKHKSLPFKGSYSFTYLLFSLILISSMVFVSLDGALTRTDGAILVVGYFLLTLLIINNVASHSKIRATKEKSQAGFFIGALLGTIGLIASSHLLVEKSVGIATLMGVPNSIIGLVMLGIGTNIPELTLLFRSNTMEKEKLAVGNFLGSALINVPTFGLLALLSPHEIAYIEVLFPAMIALIVTLVLFAIIAFSGREITRKEGFFLLAVYIIWIFIEVVLAINKF